LVEDKKMSTLKQYNENVAKLAFKKYHESKHYKINQRMHFVYLKCKGYQNKMIADILSVTLKTIYEWQNIYEENDLDTLATLNYKGQPSKLNQFAEQLVFDFIINPFTTLKQAQDHIEKATGLKRSVPQIKAFIKRVNIKRRKVGQIPDKVDVIKQDNFIKNKLNRLIKLATGNRIKLFFIDAAHFVHQPFLGYLYGLKRIFIRASSGRKRFNVLGALEAVTNKVTTVCNETYINAESVCQLLELLAKEYVGEKIYIILDNARYQRCQLVFDTAQQLGIRLFFLPPYSPNLNLIERLWKFTKKKILYNKYYPCFDEFKNAIESYMNNLKNGNYYDELKSLLRLKFQTYELQNNP
jgi:transposase